MKFILLTLIFITMTGCKSMDYGDQYKGRNIEVQGHRGARMVLPENSISAFQYALELGVDTLELDLGVTSDQQVIVYHDQKINKTICKWKSGKPITQSQWVHEMTLKEIKELDCGSQVNPRFPKQKLIPGTEVPTLEEVFQLVKKSKETTAKTVLFNIETKSDAKQPQAQPSPKEFVRLVLQLVRKYKLEKRVTIQSFDHRTLIAARKQAPDIQLAALFGEKPKDWVKATRKAKANVVSPYFKLLSKKDVKTMQNAGLKVIPWTANTPSEWAHLMDLGVDGIITDDPKPLMKMLGRL